MRTNKAQLNRICLEYDVDILMDNGGAVVFYKNTMESDVIPFDETVTENYFIDNFEMIADLSKLQLNLYALND